MLRRTADPCHRTFRLPRERGSSSASPGPSPAQRYRADIRFGQRRLWNSAADIRAVNS